MWTREMLKTNAKMKLKQYYWFGFVVCLPLTLLGGGAGGRAGSAGAGMAEDTGLRYEIAGQIPAQTVGILLTILLISLAAGMMVSAFLILPLTVGLKRFFICSGSAPARLTELFFSFRQNHYWSIVNTVFFMYLYQFLWSLLLLIPGIVKSYEYRMIPYLLAENPYMGRRRAFFLSRAMMDGEKWNVFVLDLSFFGWYLLGVLCCGLGVFFVTPYDEATGAELYLCLKEKEIRHGSINRNELAGSEEQNAGSGSVSGQ